MANAWIIRPETILGASAFATSIGDPAYVGNDHMGVIWSASAATMGGTGPYTQYITVDLGFAVAVDSVMLLGLNDGLPASVTAQLEVVSGLNGSPSWVSPRFPIYAGAKSLINGDAIGLWGADAGSFPPASRYYRVTFFSPTRVDIRLRRLVLGTRIVLARNFAFGAAFGVRDFGKLDFSDRGVMLRRRGRKLRTVGVSFENAYKDEVEAAIAPLNEQIGVTEPVALVTDPVEDAMRQRRCYFGPMVGDVGVVQRTAVGYQWRVNLVSLL